ncbi:hypothetical protein CASP1_00021 [Alcaligenes phage CASP1]|nr:hypothetical protein CASP1_00021 [Alcaligenes phage CASP1]
MKDEDIKLPKMISLVNSMSWSNDIEEYARQAVRMNAPETYIAEQAKAWMSVVGALNSVMPGWHEGAKNGQDAAVKAILDLGAKSAEAQPKQSDPEPFDLDRAKAGEPIVTRDGRKARFVAHVPEAEDHKVVAFVEGQGVATSFCETGHIYSHNHEHGIDLLMAPKPKRTVWVNIWGSKNEVGGGVHLSKENAIIAASNNGSYLAIAHPIEIDATE